MMMAGRMIVGPVGQRPTKRPQMASFRQFRQVLTNLDARGAGRYGTEFTADLERRLGLHVEALVLRQTAGEKNVDDRSRRRSALIPQRA